VKPTKTYPNYNICSNCKGQGKKSRGVSKKAQNNYQKAIIEFKKNPTLSDELLQPKGVYNVCVNCNGTGLVHSNNTNNPINENLPHVAIIGAGIGGVALAVACMHRGIPYTIFERDDNFEARAQGYGLTLQQASKALESFGIVNLRDGITSTKHIVHTTDGKVIGEWGMRQWLKSEKKETKKRSNIHIARQALRLALLEQLGGYNKVQWSHQLIDFKETENDGVEINFQVHNEVKSYKSDLLVGADGIRSIVRKSLIGDVLLF
jgi:hypothetical protein